MKKTAFERESRSPTPVLSQILEVLKRQKKRLTAIGIVQKQTTKPGETAQAYLKKLTDEIIPVDSNLNDAGKQAKVEQF